MVEIVVVDVGFVLLVPTVDDERPCREENGLCFGGDKGEACGDGDGGGGCSAVQPDVVVVAVAIRSFFVNGLGKDLIFRGEEPWFSTCGCEK